MPSHGADHPSPFPGRSSTASLPAKSVSSELPMTGQNVRKSTGQSFRNPQPLLDLAPQPRRPPHSQEGRRVFGAGFRSLASSIPASVLVVSEFTLSNQSTRCATPKWARCLTPFSFLRAICRDAAGIWLAVCRWGPQARVCSPRPSPGKRLASHW